MMDVAPLSAVPPIEAFAASVPGAAVIPSTAALVFASGGGSEASHNPGLRLRGEAALRSA